MHSERDYPPIQGHRRLFVTEDSVDTFSRMFSRPLTQPNKHLDTSVERFLKKPGGGASWFGGFTNSSEATDLVAKGWAEGAAKVRTMANELVGDIPAAKSRRRRSYWADDGHTLDPDRAMAGQWDGAYRATKRELGLGASVVELMSSWGGNCHLSSEELFWSGAALLVAADLLEDAGYAVRVTAGSFTSHSYSDDSKGDSFNKIVLKESDEPLRIDALAGILCHAGVFRSMGLHAIATSPWYVTESFGHHVEISVEKEALGARGEWPDGIVMPDSYTRTDAIRNISSIIKKLQTRADEQEQKGMRHG